MIELKPNKFCQGFDDKYDCVDFAWGKDIDGKNIIYFGKTSDIPEEIAKEYVQASSMERKDGSVFPIYMYEDKNSWFDTAKEVIEDALRKPDGKIYEFVIIWRK